jgi:phage baseplate assembly protein W
MSEEFIGRGWGFPAGVTQGRIRMVSGDREIREAIRITIGTAPGERPMRPEFGCRIHDFVFAPADSAVAGRLAYEVQVALERWEPRIEVLDIDVSNPGEEPTTFFIDIRYVHKGTNDPRNLVFPFYTIPEEEPAPAAAAGGGLLWP